MIHGLMDKVTRLSSGKLSRVDFVGLGDGIGW